MSLGAHLYTELTCKQCVNAETLGFDFSFAFQPIISVASRSIVSCEALARGLNGEPSGAVFKHVNADNLYRFDQACRVKAIKLAVELGLEVRLNLTSRPTPCTSPSSAYPPLRPATLHPRHAGRAGASRRCRSTPDWVGVRAGSARVAARYGCRTSCLSP